VYLRVEKKEKNVIIGAKKAKEIFMYEI